MNHFRHRSNVLIVDSLRFVKVSFKVENLFLEIDFITVLTIRICYPINIEMEVLIYIFYSDINGNQRKNVFQLCRVTSTRHKLVCYCNYVTISHEVANTRDPTCLRLRNYALLNGFIEL